MTFTSSAVVFVQGRADGCVRTARWCMDAGSGMRPMRMWRRFRCDVMLPRLFCWSRLRTDHGTRFSHPGVFDKIVDVPVPKVTGRGGDSAGALSAVLPEHR